MLFGHLARMDEAVLQSDWKRPAGRPHTSWLATMKNDLVYHFTTSVWKMPPNWHWTDHSGGSLAASGAASEMVQAEQ